LDGECRSRLDKVGKPEFDCNHYYGCPKFYLKCLDPVVVYNDNCKIVVDFKATKKKVKFPCKMGIYTYNCWVYRTHKLNNKVLLDEIKLDA
jgi:hypothetical protein